MPQAKTKCGKLRFKQSYLRVPGCWFVKKISSKIDKKYLKARKCYSEKYSASGKT